MNRKDIELRDWYAGLAMQTHLENDLREIGGRTDDDIAEITAVAFKIANMMISQRAYEDLNDE